VAQGLQKLPGWRVLLQRVPIESLRFFELVPLQEHPTQTSVGLDRLVRLLGLHQQVGQPQVRHVVVGIQLHELLVNLDGLLVVTVLGVPVREHLILALGLDQETLLDVQLGQAVEDVQPLWGEPVDLLQNRYRLGGEPILGEAVGDALVQLDRLVDLTDSTIEVTDPIDRISVIRVELEHLLVLTDRLLDLTLVDELLCVTQDLVPIERHADLHPPRQRSW